VKPYLVIILVLVLAALATAQERPKPGRVTPNPNDTKPQQPGNRDGQSEGPAVAVPSQIAIELAANAAKDCPQYAGSEGAKKFAETLIAHSIDLNQSGATGLVVTAQNECSCGASGGNCGTWLYGKQGDTYTMLLNAGSVLSIKTGKTLPSGYSDLMTEARSSANESIISFYKWSGNKYQATECFSHKRIPNRFGRPIFRNTKVKCEGK